MKEFRLLRADEIDVRVARVTKGSVMLLLYKNARCDQNILDETVGCMNWQRHHARDNANCIVSIWDEQKNMWIEKEDVGTESFSEKEKGLASDSFKRACFNWGIGRELYSAPNLWFPKSDCNVKNDKCYDYFVVSEIKYEDKRISEVTILNSTTGCIYNASNFQAPKGESDDAQDEKDTKDAIGSMVISKVKAASMLKRLQSADGDKLKAANISMSTIKALYKVNSIDELTETDHKDLCMALEKAGC